MVSDETQQENEDLWAEAEDNTDHYNYGRK